MPDAPSASAAVPAHTPYDGSAQPFTIGLKQLDPNEWIEVDDKLSAYLEEKERLLQSRRGAVFAETPASREAQREVLAALVDFLPSRYPDVYHRRGDVMEVGDRAVALATGDAPLLSAARLVQEDLVVMRKADDGWRLAAASLSFPSSWSLAEKFDRPIHDIHAGVPSFGPGTRNADLIARMFDNLRPERPVFRLNWSIYPDGDLHHPKSKNARGADALGENEMARIFIRVERQTLRKLPRTGAILFTIRIHADPLDALSRHEDGARLARGLREQLEGLDDAQLDYKGLRPRRAAVVAALSRIENGA